MDEADVVGQGPVQRPASSPPPIGETRTNHLRPAVAENLAPRGKHFTSRAAAKVIDVFPSGHWQLTTGNDSKLSPAAKPPVCFLASRV